MGSTEGCAERLSERDMAWRLLHEPDDWGPGTEDTSKRIDEILYEEGRASRASGTGKGALRGPKAEQPS